jgi:hypothetical protein
LRLYDVHFKRPRFRANGERQDHDDYEC